jgi:hypothetical protein
VKLTSGLIAPLNRHKDEIDEVNWVSPTMSSRLQANPVLNCDCRAAAVALVGVRGLVQVGRGAIHAQ